MHRFVALLQVSRPVSLNSSRVRRERLQMSPSLTCAQNLCTSDKKRLAAARPGRQRAGRDLHRGTAPPHQITGTATIALFPSFTAPRLPPGAQFRVIVCTCTDRELHRARLEHRTRGIPGWHEGGDWANVERRRAQFPAWTGNVLTVDAAQPLTANLATVLDYLTG
jgi:hypothetical protein